MQALPDLRQIAGDQHEVAHRPDSRRGLRGDDAAVTVGDDDGRLLAVLQHLPHGGDVLGQPGTVGACTDHALTHGLPERIEPLASASGASARMLIYHFGSRDALLRAVLQHARQRQLDTFGDLLRVRLEEPYTASLRRAWTTMTGPEGQPYLRMFGQLRESAEQQLCPDFRRIATTDWLGPLEDGLRSVGRPDLATLVLAVIRGLLMDLDATADATRTDRAFADFLRGLEALDQPRSPDGLKRQPGTSAVFAVAEPGGETLPLSEPPPDLGAQQAVCLPRVLRVALGQRRPR